MSRNQFNSINVQVTSDVKFDSFTINTLHAIRIHTRKINYRSRTSTQLQTAPKDHTFQKLERTLNDNNGYDDDDNADDGCEVDLHSFIKRTKLR